MAYTEIKEVGKNKYYYLAKSVRRGSKIEKKRVYLGTNLNEEELAKKSETANLPQADKINDLIFKELLKRGYMLEGKTRIWDLADSKLWYLSTDQAKGFLNLEKDENYRREIVEKEVKLIKDNLIKIIKILPSKNYNLVDLGCGNGQKASLFIESLRKYIKLRYYPIDISSYMVRKAAETIRRLNVGEVLEFRWNISDFENLENITPLFRDSVYHNHLMLLLGNTIGNFDKEDILHGIKNSMDKGDVLLIGNGLSSKFKHNWLEDYKTKKVNDWLIKIPLSLGLKREEVEYSARFVNSRVEELYIIKKDKKIKHLGREVDFKKGDIIIAAISYKYGKADFEKILNKFFSYVKLYLDKEETYALAICKK